MREIPLSFVSCQDMPKQQPKQRGNSLKKRERQSPPIPFHSIASIQSKESKALMLTPSASASAFAALSLCLSLVLASPLHKKAPSPVNPVDPVNQKKGLGYSPKNLGEDLSIVSSLNLAWYYDWSNTGVNSSSSPPATTTPFVPMIFSLNSMGNEIPPGTTFLLGYNEPDNTAQSDISVQDGLTNWPEVRGKLSNKGGLVGSPAMAGNPTLPGSWLHQFVEGGGTFDFLTIHWYKGPNLPRLQADLLAAYGNFSKPIWITEFACQTHAESLASPTKYTEAQVITFIQEAKAWMDGVSWIHRFAWHDSVVGTSALFNSDGGLSAAGVAYAAN